LIYEAVLPAVTVWEVIPWFATVKSAVKFKVTGVEVDEM